MIKHLFDCYLNGSSFILLMTQEGKSFICTNQGNLIHLKDGTKNHPIGCHRQDDGQEKL